jgi:citrate synthase
VEQASLLTGASAVLVAAWIRTRQHKNPIKPDVSLSHSHDFLRMIHGTCSLEQATALNSYLVCVSDHGLNASTFTARVVASTGSDLGSAVGAGIAALKGPLHGGAPGPVLDMFDAIGAIDNVQPWLENELAHKRRIMGMGHRVYRVRDPRAWVLEQATRRLAQTHPTERLAIAARVEQVAEQLLRQRHPDRPLCANVEFFTAILLEALGIPREAFSSIFATSRIAGWCGHVFEQRTHGKLIRPKSTYVGEINA